MRHARHRRGTGRRAPWRSAAADAGDQVVGQPPFAAPDLPLASRCRSPTGSRARSSDTDAAPSSSRPGSRCCATLVTQSRSASLTASLSVALPLATGCTVAPSSFMRKTLSDWRCTSSRPHEDLALHAEQRGDRRRRHAVLARPGLGDDARLAHAPRQQPLPDRVVDLVRAGVTQVLALQVDLGAAEPLGEARGEVQRRLAAGVLAQVVAHLTLKSRSRRSLR